MSEKPSKCKKAIVLLSGGLDSATALAVALKDGYQCFALTIDYGQRHRLEIEKAKLLAVTLGAIEHKIIKVELNQFGGSALTEDRAMPIINLDRAINEIPDTYVPARNTVFLSLALAWAEVVGAEALFIGVNAVDYSGYPDCRREYLKMFEKLAQLATKAGVAQDWCLEIKAPLLELSKAAIIKLGKSLNVDYSITTSCYNPDDTGTPCGQCESCLIRAKGFKEAGETDGLTLI